MGSGGTDYERAHIYGIAKGGFGVQVNSHKQINPEQALKDL
jgi:hypothetical protein